MRFQLECNDTKNNETIIIPYSCITIVHLASYAAVSKLFSGKAWVRGYHPPIHTHTCTHTFQMEAKVVLARLLSTFQVTLPENYELVPVVKFTQQPRDTVRTLHTAAQINI